MTDLKAYIAQVSGGASLNVEDARSAFEVVMSGEATPSQIGGFLMALRVRGESVEEITGAAETMRSKMLRVAAPAGAIDIVGTGGDGAGTYNISTAPRSSPQPVVCPSPSMATGPPHRNRVRRTC